MSSSLCGAVAIPSSTAFKQPNQQITRSLALAQAALAGRTKLPLAQLPGWASRGVAIAALGPVRLGSMTPAANQGQVALRNVMPQPNGVVVYNSTLQPNGQPSNTNTGLLFPLTVPAVITSIFGWRINPITGDRQFHSGTDLAAPLGTPVLAAYAGNVALANYMGGYGLAVVLEHLKPAEETLYGHLSQIFVQPGQWVEQGTIIGRVGSTGNSTGPHLHFEIRQLTPEGWVATDPGAQLQYAMAQLVQALRTAQVPHANG